MSKGGPPRDFWKFKCRFEVENQNLWNKAFISLWKSDSDSMDSTGIPRNRNGIGIEIQKYSGSGMESELRLVEVESK
jgi:hypothetical protein